ncbi:hypothetical protein V3331_12880 [Gaopeijia maritima]|uniref:hypothetical protein n=1 Tax=Gaopeijia maritima TaxID=3119007 RepID=UPI00324903CC
MYRRVGVTALVAVLAVVTPPELAGQRGAEVPADLEALEQRLEGLMREVERLEPRAQAERERRDASMRETLDAPVERVVDGLRIRALPRDVDAAVALYTAVWAEHFEPLLGSPPAALRETSLAYYDHRGEWNPRFGEDGNLSSYVQAGQNTGDVTTQAVTAISSALLRAGPMQISIWMQAEGFDPAVETRTARRRLAAVTSRSAGRCLTDTAEACLATLGLRPHGWSSADVVATWYTPEVARQVIEHRRSGGLPAEGDNLTRWFLHHRQMPVQLRTRGATPIEVIPAGIGVRHDLGPAGVEVKSSLVVHALRTGGDGAIDRLHALPASASVEEALVAVADRPLDELAASWRAELLSNDDPADRRLPTRTTFAWVGFVALLAMTSTRWRLS